MSRADEDGLTLGEYQRLAAATDLEADSEDPTVPLLGLVGEIGTLVAELKKKRRPDNVPHTGYEAIVQTEIGDILWYLAALARRAGVSLEIAAEQNLLKTQQRWLPPSERLYGAYDAGFPPTERLPRLLEVTFRSGVHSSGRAYSQMYVDGEPLGQPIDDNSLADDGYRFHDAFHLSYMSALGWSPNIRRLMKRKRKSDPRIDHAQDGARACAVEEGVAALVFQLSIGYDYFDGANRVDDSILEAVMSVTSNLEVADRTAAEWELAILSGFSAWRALRAHEEGVLVADLDRRVLEFKPIDGKSGSRA